MDHTIKFVLTAMLVCSPFCYYFRPGQKLDLQLQPHEKEIKREKGTTLFFKKSSELNQIDGLPWPAALNALSMDKVFFILLIDSCGESLVSTILELLHVLISARSLLEFASTLTLFFCVMKKMKKALERDLMGYITEHLNNDKKLKDALATLMDVKKHLENHGLETKQLLEEVASDRENNKQKLRALENELIEGEETHDKPEELLKNKENLLQYQWKLEKTKKNIERHLLNLERRMESIEMQTAGINRKPGAEQGN